MQVTINGFVTYQKHSWETEPRFEFYPFEPTSDCVGIVVKPHSFDVDVPDDFDPRPAMVAALEEQKRLAQLEFSRSVMAIDRRIQSLLAIEHVAEA